MRKELYFTGLWGKSIVASVVVLKEKKIKTKIRKSLKQENNNEERLENESRFFFSSPFGGRHFCVL